MSIEMENGVGSKEEGRDKEVAVTGHAWNFQVDPEPGQGLGQPEAPPERFRPPSSSSSSSQVRSPPNESHVTKPPAVMMHELCHVRHSSLKSGHSHLRPTVMQLLLALGDDVAVQVCFLAAVHRGGTLATLARHHHLTGIGFPDSSSLRAYPSTSHVDSLR
ncbi:uncharacterized protein STEHIDRAFT_156901 [Stereum hirsutum FP-91666 SS1]|uniref:uncharacterized protein n=1 Tax=Stereum hirsutum (strain FP-91666) TaxID=721885 RepID=UPI000440B7B8|nr:uncharacterized protein STEHIDRAFT_156901 [Stereum hirsutum FP-91666 SS1]EIM86595.1 hypothetical protein STEHIDRAFT_156901 [Stereum hirsutum FP-91666 SS1]